MTVTAAKVTAGMTIRKTKPYTGYQVCEWTTIGRVERKERGSVVLFDAAGNMLDRGIHWPANAAFEIREEPR